jgi:hypothetical protein
MNAPTDRRGGFANNFPLQLTLLVVATAVILALAWKYVW